MVRVRRDSYFYGKKLLGTTFWYDICFQPCSRAKVEGGDKCVCVCTSWQTKVGHVCGVWCGTVQRKQRGTTRLPGTATIG